MSTATRFALIDRRRDCRLVVEQGRVSFTNARATLGWHRLGFTATVDGRERAPVAVSPVRAPARTRTGIRWTLRLAYGACPLEETRRLTCCPAARTLIIERTLTNRADHPLAVDRVADGAGAEIRFATAGAYDLVRLGHLGHIRTEQLPHSRAEYPFVRNIPPARTIYGDSEDQPLPALFFCDAGRRTFLYEASLSFAPFRRCWELEGLALVNAAGRRSVLEHYAGVAVDPQRVPRTLRPGESFTASRVFYQIVENGDVNRLHDAWLDVFDEYQPPRGPASSLRRTAVYCTWNYGVFNRIDEASVLRRARFIRDHLPEISFFQVDSGYEVVDGLLAWDVGKWYPDPRQNHHRRRFQRGLAYLAQEIRKLGLRPAIWWTPKVALASRLARDHPDWLARTPAGDIWSIDDRSGALDFGRDGVRAYIARVLDFLFDDCGFAGMKMDFWSNAFVAGNIRLTGHPLECRAWLLREIRRRLPRGGFLEVCCATAMGEPGLAESADAYRCGIDIGLGAWPEQKMACCWSLPLLAIPGNRVLLANQDSLGINPAAPRHENRFRLTWCFITQGVLEVGGRLERLSAAELADVRRVLRHADRGHQVFCPDARAFTGEPFPEALFVDFPPGSLTRRRGLVQSLALFNWTDEPRIVSVRRGQLGHRIPVSAVDFWTGERLVFGDEFIVRRLDPRSALLYDIRGNSNEG